MRPLFIPYPPIERLAVIGDRRTAALVAADGTICWWCLPDFDGCPVFGALLDAKQGGYFRLGPAEVILGRQTYIPETAALQTRWDVAGGCLELTDVMLWPENERATELRDRRTILRRLRCTAGCFRCTGTIVARPDFDAPVAIGIHRIILGRGEPIGIWCSTVAADAGGCDYQFDLAEGTEVWFVIGIGEDPAEWSIECARAALDATIEYWRRWSGGLN